MLENLTLRNYAESVENRPDLSVKEQNYFVEEGFRSVLQQPLTEYRFKAVELSDQDILTMIDAQYEAGIIQNFVKKAKLLSQKGSLTPLDVTAIKNMALRLHGNYNAIKNSTAVSASKTIESFKNDVNTLKELIGEAPVK